MVYFLAAGGHFGLASAVYDVHVLGAQTLCAAGGVHCHVAAAYYGSVLAHADGGIRLGELVCLHEVYAGKELVGGVYAAKVLAGYLLEVGQSCAAAYEYGVKALFLHQLIQAYGAADYYVGLYLYAQSLHILYLLANQRLGETEFGNAVYQHAAGGMQSFENMYLIAQLRKVACAGKACGAGAYHGYLLAVGGGYLGGGGALCHGVVGGEAFQTADAYRLPLNTTDALALTLVFLGAYAAADGGKAVGGLYDGVSALVIMSGDLCYEFRNAHVYRAAGNAGHVLAVEAAGSLVEGQLFVVALRNFLKVLVADIGLLLPGRGLLQSHIRHIISPLL